jgi:hypothetical protein
MTDDDDWHNPRFPEEVATPVGQVCGDCKEEIVLGDWGQMIPHLTDGGTIIRAMHGECLARGVFGGIEHLTAPPGHPVGSCYEGSTLTRRQSAIAAYAWLREHPELP